MVEQGESKCRKWTLFSFTVVTLIVTVVVLVVAIQTINNLKMPNNVDKNSWDAAKKTVRNTVIGSGVVGILFQLLGLIGTYKENYCLVLTYAILMTLATLGSIFSAIQSSIVWASFALYLIITILAYLFARDIKLMRSNSNQPGYNA